ncbi:MAG: iron-containing alcohol dehydrogenase [Deltaproteobacteria bacterium]|nr:iron-containing alcohol dehydrogenase [Deltaproteobacteria bacterium]
MQDIKKVIEAWKPTRIHFGEGSINQVGDAVRRYADNALVVIGGGSVKENGVLARITELLDRASIRYQICEGVEPNPSKETVYRITYHLLAGNFACLLAVGGGSVIDASKAAGILAKVKQGELDDYFGVGMVSKKTERAMDLVAVPTTSGSGSEVTRFSVITDPVLGVKKLMIDAAIVPNEAIVDPELTYSCSKQVTLVSGLDAMTHLVEGYLNTVDDAADPETNDRALAGLSLLFEALPRIVRDPQDKTGRRNMALASLLGGTVLFYKQAGGPHLNSFSWCNVMDHGEACAVMLPYYGAYYAPVVGDRLKKVSQLLGVSDSGDVARDFAQGLLDFYRGLGFPLTLKEFENFSKELIGKAVSDAAQNKMKLEAMPRPVPLEKSESVLRTIIEGAWEGNLEKILKL